MRDQPTSNREAELKAPTRIGSGDWLGRRVCRVCKIEKSDADFYAHPLGIRGRRATCKDCCKKWNRTQEHREASVRWNSENKPKKSAIARAYKATEHGRKKRVANKAKCRAELSPSYVGWCLTQKTSLKTTDVPVSLIKAARVVIQLKRILWHRQKTSKN